MNTFRWVRQTRAPHQRPKGCKMPLRMLFTTTERERLGVVVNNLCFFASQMMLQGSPELSNRAVANLDRVKSDEETLLKRLDEVAREQNDESPLRVIEDLTRPPTDIGQMMTLVRRCLLASAFLGHCLAQPSHPEIASQARHPEKRLH